MSDAFMGTRLYPDGLAVEVTPNRVAIEVASRGAGGLVLVVCVMGLSIAVPLSSAGAKHLAGLLTGES